jgi:hypothetical protein
LGIIALMASNGLKKAIDNAGDYLSLFQSTKSLKAGMTLVSGGPGSGQNHTMHVLLGIILNGSVSATKITEWNSSNEDADDLGQHAYDNDRMHFKRPVIAVVTPANAMLDRMAASFQ